MRDIRPRAEEKARRRVEALHTSQGEGDGRPTGKGFESERARARQALREEVSAQRGQSVQKIAAASGEKDDGRIAEFVVRLFGHEAHGEVVVLLQLNGDDLVDVIRGDAAVSRDPQYVWLYKVRAKPMTETYKTKEGQTITRQAGSVEWTAIKRTSDGRYQAVADEGENGFDATKAATFLQSVYEPTFTPEEDEP